jgi:urease alpha subunit
MNPPGDDGTAPVDLGDGIHGCLDHENTLDTAGLAVVVVLVCPDVSWEALCKGSHHTPGECVFDLKIVGGTIVDGTGAQRFIGDVAVKDGKIVEVRRRSPADPPLGGEAVETIDATGKIVAPGFVDLHTHYDGQVSWDDVLEPSVSHGVTTVISGNCGVGFAPVRPGSEQWLIELMEGVEYIPGTALTE